MKILKVGYQHHKEKSFRIHHKDGFRMGYVFQLFWCPMLFKINGKEITVPGNSVILFEPSCPQMYWTTSDVLINDFVVFEAEPEEMEGLVFNTPFPITSPECMQKWIKLIYDEYRTAGPYCNETIGFLIKSLLAKYKERCDFYETDASPLPTQDRFHDLHMQITVFPHWDWNLTEMAHQCMLSVSYFQHMYKKMFHVAPMTEVRNSRLSLAKQLLKYTEYSVASVASQSGFKNSTHFMNQFKKKFGLSPSEYRKAVREKLPENVSLNLGNLGTQEVNYYTNFIMPKNTSEDIEEE